MPRKLQISAPTDTFPVGSVEWLTGMTIRLSNAVRHAETYGIEPIVTTARGLIPHRPWLSVPEGSPYKSADRYFKEAVGMSARDLASIMEVKDKDAATELLASCNPGKGDNQHSERLDNVKTLPDGNSRAYTLNRLKREDEKSGTDLFKRVKAGELSANAAAIAAGFRKKPTVVEQFERLWAKATREERAKICVFIDTVVWGD